MALAPMRSAAPPAQAGAPAAPPAQAPQGVLRLKKGQLLFSEGENSKALYVLKSGMIRLFLKKGDSHIELDTIHHGQVIGELSFLDGNPRSASAEALTDCELTEISGPQFLEVLKRTPEWLKVLLKTVVGRLRTSTVRIRQLESASTAFDYSGKDGKRTAQYIFMSPTDALKVATALLLVTSRKSEKAAKGLSVRVGLLQRYANQIMGIPVAKITIFLDVLKHAGLITTEGEGAQIQYFLTSADLLEDAITYINEENLLEPKKRHDISVKTLSIMSFIAKHLSRYQKNERTGMIDVNVAEIQTLESTQTGPPFRMEDFEELIKNGYTTNVNMKSATEAFCGVKSEEFLKAYSLQRIVMALAAANEEKRASGSRKK